MSDTSQKRSSSVKVASRLALGGALFLAAVLVLSLVQAPSADLASRGYAAPRSGPMKSAQDLSRAFKQASKQVMPTVVNIRSIQRLGGGEGGSANTNDPFGQLFGEEFMRRFFGEMMPQQPFEREGMGSGVIVSEDGYVLTNYHVVRDANEIEVRLSDSRTFVGKVIGTDDKSDLAVLKIEATDLPAARFGDSDALEVGDWVMAVGNPFGFDHTVTAGIVSAKSRSSVGIVDYEDFIQTDAAINPGNSGGPLLNLEGEVVGINTAIVSRAGGWNGIGLAIPSKMAQQIMDSILNDGRVIRGWMGVGIQDLNEDLAASFGYSSNEGVLISQVSPDGPADRAGLKEGDIISAYRGEPMRDAAQLRNAVAATPPDENVELRVFRDGKARTIKLKVGERESEPEVASATEGTRGLGLVVENLTPPVAQQLGYEEAKGVLVRKVEPGSVAARAGLRPNEVIVGVGSIAVDNVGDFRSAVRDADLSKGIRLKVLSPQGMQRFIFLKSRN